MVDPDITDGILNRILERLDRADVEAARRVEESVERITAQDIRSAKRIEEQNEATGKLIAHMQSQMDVMYGALTGDQLHPNGLLVKVKEVDEKVMQLDREWHQFRSTIRGFGLALGLFAGVAGGMVAAVINGLFT